MPTSSTSKRHPTANNASSKWSGAGATTFAKLTRARGSDLSEEQRHFNVQQAKFRKKSLPPSANSSIRNISSPIAFAGSGLLRNQTAKQAGKQVNLAGQMVVTAGHQQPESASGAADQPVLNATSYLSISSASSSSLAALSDLPTGSKTHLHEKPKLAGHNHHHHLHPQLGGQSAANKQQQQNQQHHPSPLSIKRQVNLKHVKTLIIGLLAIDLLISVLVHQFASQDQLAFSVWHSSFRLRFSLLNLVLTAIWFILLIGAILFDVYAVLLASCLVEASSFVVLVCFSAHHFSRRIDYNSVQLTHLLALLFSVVFLHVYLVVVTSLMIYLTLAVRRRRSETGRRL